MECCVGQVNVGQDHNQQHDKYHATENEQRRCFDSPSQHDHMFLTESRLPVNALKVVVQELGWKTSARKSMLGLSRQNVPVQTGKLHIQPVQALCRGSSGDPGLCISNRKRWTRQLPCWHLQVDRFWPAARTFIPHSGIGCRQVALSTLLPSVRFTAFPLSATTFASVR